MNKKKLSLILVLVLVVNCFWGVQAFSAAKEIVTLGSTPKNNAVNVKVDTGISIKFSKPIKRGKSYSGIKLGKVKGSYLGAIISIKGNLLNIKPLKVLEYNTIYSVKVPKNALIDSSGKTTRGDILIKFRTAPKPKPVSSSGTVNNSSGQGNKPDDTKNDNTTASAIEAAPNPGNEKDNTNTTGSAIEISGNNTDKATTGAAIEPSNPGQVGSKKIISHGFYSGYTKYSEETEKYLKGLDTVSFAWLKLQNTNGSVELKTNTPGHDFHIPADYSRSLEYCLKNNIPAQISIFSDGETAKQIMANSTSRGILIQRIVDSLKISLDNKQMFDFNGVVIDFEGFKQNDTKLNFNIFLKELKAVLGPINKKLYVAVNVRRYYPGYDYKEILKYADRVILMAHDYEPQGNITKSDLVKYINYKAANPIDSLAPINRVKIDLEDLIGAANSIDDKDKIILQISFATAQWQFTMGTMGDWTNIGTNIIGERSTPGYIKLMNRLDNKDNYGANITYGYIKELESPYITYYNTFVKSYNFIIYEDSRSVQAKINLAKTEGIGGISLWRLGTIPDNTSDVGVKYNLNVWDAIKESLK